MEAEVLGTAPSNNGAVTDSVTTSEAFRVGPFDDPDRYEIGPPVEGGAEGILYRGQLVTPTSRLSLSVAVKALQPAYASRIDQWAARWRDQVELLRSLQIPGLVGVREGFVGPLPHHQGAETAGRNLYLVMNWVEGEALDHWVLRQRGVDIGHALKLLLPVAVAVDTMHGGQLTGSVPVVHRDIKPANILIGPGGSVLVDFGLTKGLSIGHPVGRAGTPGYIAPEVVAGGGYTPAADRYAFGATVFFLLTGRHPSTTGQPSELRRLLETSPAGGETGNGGAIPPELVERVVAMLDPDPLRRPAALANWIAQLRQSSLDDEVLTVRLAPPAPARSRRSRGGEHSARTNGTNGSGRFAAPPRSRAAAAGAGSAIAGGVGIGVGSASGPTGSGQPSSGPSAIGGTNGHARGAVAGADPVAPLALGTLPATAPTDTGLAAVEEAAARSGEASLVDTAGAPGHRRGGAHRAPSRTPLHARHQRVVTGRYAMVIILAVALATVASDAGATSRPVRRLVGPLALPITPGTNAASPAPVNLRFGRDNGGPGNAVSTSPLSLALGSDPAKETGKTVPIVTTPVPPGSPSCSQSYSASCPPLSWSPMPINKPLTIKVSYTPQHPLPGQPVTFTVTLDDPDDANHLQLDSAYYGDAASSAGAGASVGAVTAGPLPPGCQTPRGTWPPPAPGPAGHVELQRTYTYTSPGTYQVRFTASSGLDVNPCALPDPYASFAQSDAQAVVVDPPPPPPTTTTTTTAPPPPPPTTTTTLAKPAP